MAFFRYLVGFVFSIELNYSGWLKSLYTRGNPFVSKVNNKFVIKCYDHLVIQRLVKIHDWQPIGKQENLMRKTHTNAPCINRPIDVHK